MSADIAALAYLASGALFILALRGLSSPETSRRGNLLGMLGMAIAVVTTLVLADIAEGLTWGLIVLGVGIGGGAGAVIARRIPMTAMPQLVAAFHSLVGMAAVLVAAAALNTPDAYGIGTVGGIRVASLVEMSIGSAIGAVTFTGSVVAFTKLQGLVSGRPVVFPGQHFLNAALGILLVALTIWFCRTESHTAFWALTLLAFAIGVLIIIPIGGADMPVVVSMLNSYSGWAAAGIGFTLENTALIITGALVGSSGAILSYIMCKGMNRSFFSVILGGFGGETDFAAGGALEQRPVKQGSAEDAAFIMKNAGSVIIVPGYGMAVAQAQHALREMADTLKSEGVKVSYAIHPVAGTDAGAHERAAGRGQRALRRGLRARRHQQPVRADGRRLRHRRERRDESRREEQPAEPHLRDAGARRRAIEVRAVRQARHGVGLRRNRERALLPGQHHDAVLRREEDGRGDCEGDVGRTV